MTAKSLSVQKKLATGYRLSVGKKKGKKKKKKKKEEEGKNGTKK